MMDSKLVKETYNKIAENYSVERDQFENRKYLDKLAELLKPGATVLDIGCGAGIPVDKYLVGKGFKVVGLDISEKQIKLARKNLPRTEFEVKDMADLDASAYQVDAVISFYAIFHIPKEQHQGLLEKINSFLPDGGSILITMGASEWEGEDKDFYGGKMWWSHFGPEKNKEILKKAGFKLLFNEIDISGGEKHQVILAQKIRLSDNLLS